MQRQARLSKMKRKNERFVPPRKISGANYGETFGCIRKTHDVLFGEVCHIAISLNLRRSVAG